MKRLSRFLLEKILPAALGLGVYATAQASDVTGQRRWPEEIRIAVPDLSAGSEHSGGGVVDVLRSQRIFEEAFAAEGVKVRWLFFKGAGPVINEAFANGQVDLAYLGDFAAIIGKASGLDTRLLSATARNIQHYLGVPSGSPIGSLQDLRGKRVAVFKGTANQLSFAQALASQGLGERDVKSVSLDFNAATAALAARQIDAAWGSTNLLALQLRGLAELPVSTRDLGGAGDLQGVLVGRGEFVERYPQLIQRLLSVQQKASDWLRQAQHRQDYIDLVAGLSGYPRALLERDLQAQDFSVIFDPRLDAGFLDRLQNSVDFAAQQRLIRKDFDVREWLADSPVQAASSAPPLVVDLGLLAGAFAH
ncbi:ABC transporter substrate-binding protein [Pseudomonas sp. ABC1]|uniref:ABC transporter substrate-binding protein n=1 Tax=Pseudomonas sp. ABC1 TaxID=2748080 RepID=UPI0015C2C622|nr:ABC transporter substrate-binding protein [Pseudomonas sp. ABC1]QLF94339.1 ABC transporter substrate-binding protein [Pseudomonas sp. ABC1]